MYRFLFPICIFLSAILLFSIQPMVAKSLLPVYGGTPAVWIVCMLFFQLVLLVSYGYTWLLSFIKKPLIWCLIHTVLIILSFIALPLVFRPLPMNFQPELSILYDLLTQIGLPLLIVGASAPLLQFAYSQTKGKGALDPYFLYVASNLGSLIALLIYPWVIERFIGLTVQFHLWSIGYFIYIGVLLIVLYFVRYQPLPKLNNHSEAWPWRNMVYWIFLSFIPCSLMLSVTLYITTDVAATPLFWVLPLALYLLSFVIVFTTKPLISQAWIARNCLFFLIFPVLGFILGISEIVAWQMILFNLLNFFILTLLCHGQLFERRPPPQLLTLFYFCLAIGGVLAGIFNGIFAPHWFNQIYEYPLAILLSLLVLPTNSSKNNFKKGYWLPLVILVLIIFYYFSPTLYGIQIFQYIAIFALILIVLFSQNRINLILSMFLLFSLIFLPIFGHDNILTQKRNFYGVKKVIEKGSAHVFISQSTLHGLQLFDERKTLNGFGSYYGPVETVVKEMEQQFDSMLVTIMGLGVGTMLCQFRATDHVTVIEIDQQIIDIAQNPKLFTFVRDCLPKIEIIKNDGRLALTQTPDGSQNLLFLDAFNSDSIPVHLMTLEAFNLYKKKMSPNGAILINLSNRHVDLFPVINAFAHSLNLQILHLFDGGNPQKYQFASKWAVLTTNQSVINKLKQKGWQSIDKSKQFLWTDDYSNIIPLLHLI